jgi:hypothetical protein
MHLINSIAFKFASFIRSERSMLKLMNLSREHQRQGKELSKYSSY